MMRVLLELSSSTTTYARIEWPTYSRDLNPIGIFCDSSGRAVCTRFLSSVTITGLQTVLQKEWRLLVSDHLKESIGHSAKCVFR